MTPLERARCEINIAFQQREFLNIDLVKNYRAEQYSTDVKKIRQELNRKIYLLRMQLEVVSLSRETNLQA